MSKEPFSPEKASPKLCVICGKETTGISTETISAPCCSTCDFSPYEKLEKENAQLKADIENYDWHIGFAVDEITTLRARIEKAPVLLNKRIKERQIASSHSWNSTNEQELLKIELEDLELIKEALEGRDK